ncbi:MULTISPECIES: FadR/GntR family transcriptional regulator [unclassified Sporosarcina]|uniref:FadR/GntR family transcriptional regulator n=1 Tax=unclassified Sporosarcina TaxID=2647733 RepID=UPI00203D1CFD|nr:MULTISPECIES: FadR/GntR family transcriptional regulator [unclassified Sporosarcina]GKV66509.1 transcriptional regulator [Sporosarcina sp. NCCP-2331]GLB56786.1 transcriptional regulator [Sporosarcina sp. NCCP-2378]
MNKEWSFQPLRSHRLVDDVVNQLQYKISKGEIQLGEKLPPEPKLMELFGVGRSTIREAIRVLVHAGLLEKRQGFGTFLKTNPTIQEPLTHRLHRAELMEVYEARKMVELEMVRLAAIRRDEADLQNMREHLDIRHSALQHDDRELYTKSDIEFHMSIAIACKNGVIIDLFRSFSQEMTHAMHMLNKEYRSHNPQSEYHEKLYEAIKDKDSDLAATYTKLIIEGTIAEL